MSPARRATLIAAVVVIAIVAFIVLKPGNNSNQSSSQSSSGGALQTVLVRNAKPVGGIKDLNFKKGGTVRFKVDSDVADEIHVHGYDIMKDVKPGHPITFSFPGKIDGEFVVELEGRKQQIATLRVNP